MKDNKETTEKDAKFNEFDDIKIPEFLLNDNWEDTSWHNDLAPKMTFKKNLGHNILLDVWVYDKSYSDMNIDYKYYVAICDDGVIDENTAVSCNTEAEVGRAVNKLLAYLGYGM